MNLSFLKPAPEQMLPQSPKLKYVLLIFSLFYFIRWAYGYMSPTDWAIQITAFVVFLILYFAAFRWLNGVVLLSLCMIGLSVAIAPYNQGSNTFAIYAANFFAYTLPSKRASFYILFTVAVMALATYIFNLNFIGYFVIGAAIVMGGGFIAIINRQSVLHLQRQNKTQEEISRLAKIAERERIGQDLHDLLGHSLTVIHLKSQLCLQQLNNNLIDDAKAEVATICDTAKNAIQEVRGAVTGYKTHNLEQELQSQKSFFASLGIELSYKLPNTIIPPMLESDLMLIAREALTNILRHAKASQCSVECEAETDGVKMIIKDNGHGVASNKNHHSGSGVLGMTQRVESRGGQLTFNSAKGVTITLFMPWPKDEQ